MGARKGHPYRWGGLVSEEGTGTPQVSTAWPGCGLCFSNSTLLGRRWSSGKRRHQNSSGRGDPYQQKQEDICPEGEDPG